jgi:hypothetical protein
MKKNITKRKARVNAHSAMKEKENVVAQDLSKDLDEAVEKSFAKSSSDEARSSPRAK